ncbi:MAG: exodeoxyribonuclease VII small subunit [bacterium]
MSDKNSTPDFETSLKDLETLTHKMESGELNLDESLKSFEKGVKLINNCRETLKNAELQVETLLKKLPDTQPHE